MQDHFVPCRMAQAACCLVNVLVARPNQETSDGRSHIAHSDFIRQYGFRCVGAQACFMSCIVPKYSHTGHVHVPTFTLTHMRVMTCPQQQSPMTLGCPSHYNLIICLPTCISSVCCAASHVLGSSRFVAQFLARACTASTNLCELKSAMSCIWMARSFSDGSAALACRISLWACRTLLGEAIGDWLSAALA
jgi:hypothetical protein